MAEAATPKPTLLSQYAPYPFRLDKAELEFTLRPRATRVIARLHFQPNLDHPGRHDLRLDGEGLRLVVAKVDGVALPAQDFRLDETGLTVPAARLPEGAFLWEAEVEIDPEANTALEGLYMSNGMYCCLLYTFSEPTRPY